MAENTKPSRLPFGSYEEAYPWLRRPYLPSQVYGKVQTTPANPAEPCAISLYSKSETLFDRLNLLCGTAWAHTFTVKRESRGPDGQAKNMRFYCEVEAVLTIFDKTDSDIGEGFGATRAHAEMNARAQANKRSGRKFGPGLCLYSCDQILMFRGGEGDDRLCVAAEGKDRFFHPWFDQDGHGVAYVRGRYQAYLDAYGIGIFGQPLDHLALAAILESSPQERTSIVVPASVPTERPAAGVSPAATLIAAPAGLPPAPPEQNGHGSATTPKAEAPAAQPPATAQASDYLPMADHPAPIAAVRAAAAHGFGQDVARALCNLVRGEGQDEHVSRQQLGTVENWLTMLHSLSIAEAALLSAAGHNAKRRTTQERRQALFSQWLARRAAGEPPKSEGQPPPSPGDGSAGQPSTPPASEKKEDPAELAQAVAELQKRASEHDYQEQAISRLAALALGRGPNTKVSMGQLGTELVMTLTDLIDCAASIGWDSERLDRELLEAHGSNQHASTAGRFSAFANQLKDLAESRAGGDT